MAMMPPAEFRDHHGYQEGAHPSGAAFQVDFDLLEHSRGTADAGAHNAANAQAVLVADLHAAIRDGLLGRSQRQLGEAVHVARFAVSEHLFAVETFDLGGYLAFLLSGVEQRDRPGAGGAGKDARPGGLNVQAQGADATQAGDND